MSLYPSEYIQCTCTIVEQFAPMAYRATLPNNKPTVAFIQKKEAHLLAILKAGDQVRVSICPANFDRARIRDIVTPD
ncbi:MAG: hypothetical protein R3Y56_07045 [Akkermansia sp.]